MSLVAFTIATNNGISGTRIFGEVIAKGSSNNTLTLEQNTFGNNYFQIYPNPVGSDFTLSTSKNLETNSKITIYTTEGKLIKTNIVLNSLQTINVEYLSKGIYILKIQNGNKQYQTKFIKL